MIISVKRPVYCTTYNAAIIDKDRILKNTASPKIIFIGGSNLAYGLDSRSVQEQLGMPVVNLGLTAAFGLAFMLEQAKSNINAGDVIVISPEYPLLTGLADGKNTSDLIEAVFFYPESMKYIVSFKQVYKTIAGFFPFLDKIRRIFFRPENYLEIKKAIARRNGFNEFGDMTLHLSLRNQYPNEKKEESADDPFDLNRAAALFNSFHAYVSSRHAKVFLIPPPYPSRNYPLRIKHNAMYAHLKWLIKIPILASPEEFYFPDSYFFNTYYHLTAQGREVRTRKVISILQKALL